jgi:hypothetical protein
LKYGDIIDKIKKYAVFSYFGVILGEMLDYMAIYFFKENIFKSDNKISISYISTEAFASFRVL